MGVLVPMPPEFQEQHLPPTPPLQQPSNRGQVDETVSMELTVASRPQHKRSRRAFKRFRIP